MQKCVDWSLGAEQRLLLHQKNAQFVRSNPFSHFIERGATQDVLVSLAIDHVAPKRPCSYLNGGLVYDINSGPGWEIIENLYLIVGFRKGNDGIVILFVWLRSD